MMTPTTPPTTTPAPASLAPETPPPTVPAPGFGRSRRSLAAAWTRLPATPATVILTPQ